MKRARGAALRVEAEELTSTKVARISVPTKFRCGVLRSTCVYHDTGLADRRDEDRTASVPLE